VATEQKLSHNRILIALNDLWDSLAHNPERQALESAQWCIAHAPHLADALSAKIHAVLPDSLLKQLLFKPKSLEVDGRIAALNILAHCKSSYAPDPNRQIQAAAKFIKRQPKVKSGSAKRAAVTTFEEIFGITPQILPPTQATPIRVDWELGRLSIPLQLASPFRLWVLARDITRSEQGSGVITRRSLWEKVQAYRIPCTKRHFNRLLKDGNGRFWYCVGKKLFLRGIQPVACWMTALAREAGVPTEGNLPGNRDVLLDPSGSLEQWEGMLYAGWYAGRGEKGKGDVTIARETLAGLFGRDETTLRRWEQDRLQHIVTVQPNIAQYAPDDDELDIDHIPAHAQPYLAQIRTTEGIAHEARLMWQLPNTYHSAVRTHAHKGQASKVRRAARRSIDDPAAIKRGGQTRRYFQSAKALKARQRSRKFRMGLMGDVTKRVYVFIGQHERSQRGVFEWTNREMPLTRAEERATPLVEAAYFGGKGASEHAFWQARREAFLD
jgi:hypothetical protein